MKNIEIDNKAKAKSKNWIVGIIIFVFFFICVSYIDIKDTNNEGGGIPMILFDINLPGYILYLITSGDIHGANPGPYGQIGRIIITSIGSSLFWCFIAYLTIKTISFFKS